jgi:hypothetical protein
MKRLVAVIVVAAALSACSSGSSGSAAPGDVLLSRLPSPLPQTIATARALSSNDVATATPADPARVGRFLGAASFRGAYVRVWKQDPDYVTLLAVAFDQPADAVKFVQLEKDDLSKGTNTYVTPHEQIPGSYVFVIHGQTRAGEHSVICEGVWLPAGRYAIETLTCSSTGAWATWAEQLAQQESDQVKQVAS